MLQIQFVAFNTGLTSHQQKLNVTQGQIKRFVKLYTPGAQVSFSVTIHVQQAHVHQMFNVASTQSAQDDLPLDI